MAAPSAGDIAPDFEAEDTEGGVHRLSEMVEAGPVILAFFPKAFTPGWTRELKSYRARYDEFLAKGAQILAISTDRKARQAEFRRAIGAPFAFIADTRGELTRLFGVKTPVVTFARRFTFVIGKERVVLRVESGGDAIDPSGAAEACSLYWPAGRTPSGRRWSSAAAPRVTGGERAAGHQYRDELMVHL